MKSIFRRDAKASRREDLASLVDIPLLSESLRPVIEESVEACGKAAWRRGTCLTATVVVLFVSGLAIRRDLSDSAVLNWLLSGWRWSTCRLPRKLVADGTLGRARQRLGMDVLRRIFDNLVARQPALPKDFHGLTSAAFDGTTAGMPDTPANQQRFGRPNGGRGAGGFPQLRAVALLILPLRLVVDVADAAYQGKGTGERSLMNTLIARVRQADLLYLLDAGLYSFELPALLQTKNNHQLLAKLSASVKPERCRGGRLPDGSYLAQVERKGVVFTVRIIVHRIPGFRPARLITTLLDPAIGARELAIHDHRPRDIEIAYDEIKTHQCATLRGRAPTTFRSKSPELVEQELYAVLIVYNLVRENIHEAVARQPEQVRRIGFLDALQCIIDAVPHLCIAGAAQAEEQFHYLRSLIAECEIDRPQRNRINPRVVKVKMSKFKRKRKNHKSTLRNLESELEVLTLETA